MPSEDLRHHNCAILPCKRSILTQKSLLSVMNALIFCTISGSNAALLRNFSVLKDGFAQKLRFTCALSPKNPSKVYHHRVVLHSKAMPYKVKPRVIRHRLRKHYCVANPDSQLHAELAPRASEYYVRHLRPRQAHRRQADNRSRVRSAEYHRVYLGRQ